MRCIDVEGRQAAYVACLVLRPADLVPVRPALTGVHEVVGTRTHHPRRQKQDQPNEYGDGCPRVCAQRVFPVQDREENGDPKGEDYERPANHVLKRPAPVPRPRLDDHSRAVLTNEVSVVHTPLNRENLGCTVGKALHEHTPALVTKPLNSFALFSCSGCPFARHSGALSSCTSLG
jgi:hypothetical protein